MASIYAILFILLMIVYALSLVMPNWTAALIVGVTLAVAATLMLSAGARRFRQIHPTPVRTVDNIKENVEWARQQAK